MPTCSLAPAASYVLGGSLSCVTFVPGVTLRVSVWAAASLWDRSRPAPQAKKTARATIAPAILSLARNIVLSTPFIAAVTLADTAARPPLATAAAALAVKDTSASGILADAAIPDNAFASTAHATGAQ